jgi:hypothetical protein
MPINLTPSQRRYAWVAGDLRYRLRNNQQIAKDAADEAFKTFLKFLLYCHRRFGKSDYGLTWLTEDCIKNPGSVSAYFAPVKEGLSDYIQPIIAQTYSDCPQDLQPVLDSSLTLHFPNGSTIIFRGSNNKSHRTKRGNAFRKVFIDEPRDVDELNVLLESVVLPSLFSTEGQVMLGSTPPDTEDHDLSTIKDQAEREGWYFHWDITQSAKSDPQDFPQDRIDQWRRETIDKAAWQREYMAVLTKDPTKTVIPEWSVNHEQPIERDEFFQFYHKYVSMDLGVKDKHAGIFGFYDFKRAVLFIESEFTLKDAEVLTKTIAQRVEDEEVRLGYQLLHDKENPLYKDLAVNEKVYRRIADNNNPLLVNDLNSDYGLDFFGTRKDELFAMINMTREWVNDDRIVVAPTCKELLGCLRNALWDKNKKELARSKVYGHFDALMALVYLVRNIDTQTNPVPKYYGKRYDTHGIPLNANAMPETQASKLAQIFKIKSPINDAREQFARGGGQ